MTRKNDDSDENEPGHAGNGESSIYKGADGYWHGHVSMGAETTGGRGDRTSSARAAPKSSRSSAKLERHRDAGTALKPGPAWTFEQWLLSLNAISRRRQVIAHTTAITTMRCQNLRCQSLAELSPASGPI